jgi:hypothetical protein
MLDPERLHSILQNGVVPAVEISLFVFLMMVVVDYLNVWTEGRLTRVLRGGRGRQVVFSSALGLLPGCIGVFLVVALYVRGMLSFGGLAANFLSTTGDVAFVMLAKIPKTALLLFAILFVVGVVFGWVSDWIYTRFNLSAEAECKIESHHLGDPGCRCWPEEGVWHQTKTTGWLRWIYLLATLLALAAVFSGRLGPLEWNWERIGIVGLVAISLFVFFTVPDHYLTEHIFHHITRRHLPRVFGWTLGALLLLSFLDGVVDLKSIASEHAVVAILVASLAGLVPDSGPQLVFVFLFAEGAVPFSVLLANCVAQSGHGLLPLLSVSRRDSVLVKTVNVLLGMAFGLAAFAFGY